MIVHSKEHVAVVDGSNCANFVSDGDLPADKINSELSGRKRQRRRQRGDIALGDTAGSCLDLYNLTLRGGKPTCTWSQIQIDLLCTVK